MLSCVVGLSLLGVVERALLDGGTVGASGTVGDDTPARSHRERAKPGRREAPRRTPGPSGGPAAPAAPDPAVLTARVRELTLEQRGATARRSYGAAPSRPPVVDTARTSADGTWAFGTTAIPVPAASAATPEIAFFAARWRRGRWEIGLSGGAAFTGLLSAMPASLMSAAEAGALRRYAALTAEGANALVNGSRTGDGLMLPWKSGAVWSMTAGEPPGGAAGRPLGSLAFSGGDGRVLSSGAGRLYRFCGDAAGRALVMVVHRSGLATTYYRVRSVPRLRDGSVVGRGEPIGRTGTDLPCGGAAAPRPQVGFDLRRGTERVPLDGARIGGWTFRERAEPLLGFAERGDLQVLPGGLLANLGPVPAADDPPPSPLPGTPPEDGTPGRAKPGGAPSPSAT
ncbi:MULTISPECIES: hypothetical protein [Actinomadura]|uniref:Peptidase family M23 n=1 Tax=Actinomadura litoris TaxID=2678616 RepID=A0A7K1LBR8_9ACTN|nr:MULTISPECIES: hypothetical protein [Actinomadura]MBT2209671.1 hypothetical protein [Actinomadura sp. NEAU-AAG7]MUN41869.1 hypothetical protein [Actinomadura litoris]